MIKKSIETYFVISRTKLYFNSQSSIKWSSFMGWYKNIAVRQEYIDRSIIIGHKGNVTEISLFKRNKDIMKALENGIITM